MDDPNITMPTLYTESVILDDDAVLILDRRCFPFEKSFVVCANYEDVAYAIEDMVTQSNGPFYATGAAMVLAARSVNKAPAPKRIEEIVKAGKRLIATRPTNNNIAHAVKTVVEHAERCADDVDDFASSVEAIVRLDWDGRRRRLADIGRHAASLISDGEKIMTYCWSEGAIMETLVCVLRQGKRVELVCPETRPYLQGARLTAHSAAEMGLKTTVITDGMCAHAMAQSRVSMMMTAADRITMSGHVINKVGTAQAAIAARHFNIPYFATVLEPDRLARTPDDVELEERHPDEALHCLGQRTASPLAQGWYPAFDVTPPELVSGIVTRFGVFPAAALAATLPDY